MLTPMVTVDAAMVVVLPATVVVEPATVLVMVVGAQVPWVVYAER